MHIPTRICLAECLQGSISFACYRSPLVVADAPYAPARCITTLVWIRLSTLCLEMQLSADIVVLAEVRLVIIIRVGNLKDSHMQQLEKQPSATLPSMSLV